MKRLLLILTSIFFPLAVVAQTVGQWELRKRGATGFTSYGFTAEDGKVIGFAAGIPVMVAPTGGSTTFAGLTDVDLTSVASGDMLKWNGTDWINRTASNVRTDLGLVIGANVQAYDPDLTTYAGITPSANVQSLLGAADYAAMRTLMGLVIGTDVAPIGSIVVVSTTGVQTPYATIALAKAAATSGQTVVVGPGTYAVTASILKNGVNWYFAPGATVTMTCDNTDTGILHDDNSAISCVVAGEGVFVQTLINFAFGYIGCAATYHADSNVVIHAKSITCKQGAGGTSIANPMAVYGKAGRLVVECSDFIYGEDLSDGYSGMAVYWENGPMHVKAPHIYGTNFAIWAHCDSTPTGDLYVTADLIETTSTNLSGDPAVIIDYSSNSSGASWIHAKVIKSPGSGVPAVFGLHSGKLYVTAQKIFGRVYNSGIVGTPLTYVECDKLEAVGNGGATAPGLVYSTGGTLRLTCRHWSPVSYTGEMFEITGGTVHLTGGDFTGAASAKGINITGGTARLSNINLDTSANSSTSPLTKSGGTLTLDAGVVLTAHASADSISAPSAQTVYASAPVYYNRALDADVTLDSTGARLAGALGTITGTLPVANGGTGAATAAGARASLLPSMTGNTLKVLRVNAGETDYELATISSGLTVGTTAVASGTASRLLYETAGNVVGEISGATSDGTTLTLTAPILGTPASGTLTNCTGLPPAGVTGTAAILGANTFTAAQMIDGSGDAVQLTVQGHSTQTSNIMLIEKSDGTDLFAFQNGGACVVGNGGGFAHSSAPTNFYIELVNGGYLQYLGGGAGGFYTGQTVFNFGSGMRLSWDSGSTPSSGAGDVVLERNTTRTLGIRGNSTNDANLRLYGDGTTATKYLTLKHDGTNGVISASSGTVNVTTGGLTIGSGGTAITQVLSTTTTWDAANLADGASETKASVTLTGAAVGDICVADLSSITSASWDIEAVVSATNTVEARITNRTGGAVDLASGTLRITVIQH